MERKPWIFYLNKKLKNHIKNCYYYTLIPKKHIYNEPRY